MFIRGRFVNADGVEHQLMFFQLEEKKQLDFLQAAKIAKKNFLTICSDRNGLIRVAIVEPHVYRRVPKRASNNSLGGHFFNSLRNHIGMPMSTYDLVKRLPEKVVDEEIIKIAQLHLAENSGEQIGYNHKK